MGHHCNWTESIQGKIDLQGKDQVAKDGEQHFHSVVVVVFCLEKLSTPGAGGNPKSNESDMTCVTVIKES